MSVIDERRRQSRAGAVSRQAMPKGRLVFQTVGGKLFVVPKLQHGEVVINADGTFCSQETWDTIRCSPPAVTSFMEGMVRSDTSHGYRRLDLGIIWWSDALRLESAKFGTDVIRGKDRITQLEERLVDLLTRATSFSSDECTDPGHLQQFFGETLGLGLDVKETKDRVGYLEALLALITEAVGELH